MDAAHPTFHALADDTRRRILDLLRQQNLAAGEIAGRFPKLSRPAVSKHLRILRRSHLVSARKLGRERIYSLDASPLRQVEKWIHRYQTHWDQQLGSLRRYLDSAIEEGERGHDR